MLDVKEEWSGGNQKENVLSGAILRREGSGADLEKNVSQSSMDEADFMEKTANNWFIFD